MTAKVFDGRDDVECSMREKRHCIQFQFLSALLCRRPVKTQTKRQDDGNRHEEIYTLDEEEVPAETVPLPCCFLLHKAFRLFYQNPEGSSRRVTRTRKGILTSPKSSCPRLSTTRLEPEKGLPAFSPCLLSSRLFFFLQTTLRPELNKTHLEFAKLKCLARQMIVMQVKRCV
jgi:hypothetical protein